MLYGLGSGFLWAVQTVILSLVLAAGIFTQSSQAVFLAPVVGAFLNDAISGVWLLVFRKSYRPFRGSNVLTLLKSRQGKLLLLSGLCGGPLGMGAYVLSIRCVGVTDTAVISALYPVVGSILARLFLHEALSGKQMAGILMSAAGVIGMVGLPWGNSGHAVNYIPAFACALFWSLEAVLSSYGMKHGSIPFEAALQIRQGTSFLCYAVVFLPMLNAWSFTGHILSNRIILLLFLTALLETGSYLLYYKSISVTGPSKAMSMNITYIIWSILLSILIFKKLPTAYEALSIVILSAGVFMVIGFGRKNKGCEL
ncbi:EamA-like transporter family protein [Ruminiclostridium hungatei]|uniref:EamA-like transporter family protein n=1 Tax=Ruminiclostridium hungatei TaxID=48256 RepID=A0A1V4SEP6_RUMHU|nr:DMT family transporter [Ruminiclostridium hungatei]OPX41935.1 EamA-like transporter family protein [Ruminiclostridium hungatei]